MWICSSLTFRIVSTSTERPSFHTCVAVGREATTVFAHEIAATPKQLYSSWGKRLPNTCYLVWAPTCACLLLLYGQRVISLSP